VFVNLCLMSLDLLGREFIRRGANRLGLEGRLNDFVGLINTYNRSNRCVPGDVVAEYVDSLFMPIIENTRQLAFGYRVDDKVNYYLRRYLKANDLYGFIKDVLGKSNYAELDAINSDNNWAVPQWFGFYFYICPVGGGTCASTPSYTCVTTVKDNAGDYVCCTGEYIETAIKYLIMQDTVPYKTTYDSGTFGITTQVPSGTGTFTVNGSFTAPSCFPSSGVSLNLDLVVYPSSSGSGTCGSSCPSSNVCYSKTMYNCGTTGNSYNSSYPVFYYNVGLTAVPGSTYSVWVQYSTY